MDKDATWNGGRPQSRRHCVGWRTQLCLKRGTAPNFRPMSIVAKRLGGSRSYTWYEGRPGKVDLGRGHIVLDGDPAPPKKGQSPTIFTPCLLWPNDWMDQDATWYGGRPRPRRHCVGWGTQLPLKGAQPPIFGPCLLWPNGLMGQDATWYESRPRPSPYCVRWEPSSSPQ